MRQSFQDQFQNLSSQLLSNIRHFFPSDEVSIDVIYFLRYLDRVKNLLNTRQDQIKFLEDLNKLSQFLQNQQAVKVSEIQQILDYYYRLLIQRRLEQFRILGARVYQNSSSRIFRKIYDVGKKVYRDREVYHVTHDFDTDSADIFRRILTLSEDGNYDRYPLVIEYVDTLCEDCNDARRDGSLPMQRRFWGAWHPRAQQLLDIERIKEVGYLNAKKREMGEENFIPFLKNWIRKECLTACFLYDVYGCLLTAGDQAKLKNFLYNNQAVPNDVFKKWLINLSHPSLVIDAIRRMQRWADIGMEVGCDSGVALAISEALQQPELVTLQKVSHKIPKNFKRENQVLEEKKDELHESFSANYFKNFAEKTKQQCNAVNANQSLPQEDKGKKISTLKYKIMVKKLLVVGRNLKEKLVDLLQAKEKNIPKILVKLCEIYRENDSHLIKDDHEVGSVKMISILKKELSLLSKQELFLIEKFMKEKNGDIQNCFCSNGSEISSIVITSWNALETAVYETCEILKADEKEIRNQYTQIIDCIRNNLYQMQEKIDEFERGFFNFFKRRKVDPKTAHALMMEKEYLNNIEKHISEKHNPVAIIQGLILFFQSSKTRSKNLLEADFAKILHCREGKVIMELSLFKEKLEHLKIETIGAKNLDSKAMGSEPMYLTL